jgi:hypothetical protein
MGQARLQKYNTLSSGFIPGLIIPVFILILIYLSRYSSIPFQIYLVNLWKMSLLFKLLSLFGFVNLLLFLGFYRSRMDRAARGVIMATFVYAILILVSKLM